MQQKTKAILIGLIVIILIVTVVYAFKKLGSGKGTNAPGQKQTSQQQTAEQSNKPQTFTTIKADGTVSQISENSIEIKNGDTKNTFSISKDTTVLSVNGSQVTKKSISDLKKDQNVSLTINQANSQIVSIQIIEGSTGGKAIF
jgi:hypothetical protein